MERYRKVQSRLKMKEASIENPLATALRTTIEEGEALLKEQETNTKIVKRMLEILQMRELYGDRLMVIAAWGALAPSIAKKRGSPEYVSKVVEIVERSGVKLHCLDLSKDGHPKHPLYLKGTLKPQPYSHVEIGQ